MKQDRRPSLADVIVLFIACILIASIIFAFALRFVDFLINKQ